MNNSKAEKELHLKKREKDEKNAVAFAKNVSQLTGETKIQMQPLLTVEVWVNTGAESLGTNSKVYHFTKSAILQTSIQEQKGPSLVKLSKFLISEVPSL